MLIGLNPFGVRIATARTHEHVLHLLRNFAHRIHHPVDQQDRRKFANARFALAFFWGWSYNSYSQVKAKRNLAKLSILALRHRRQGLTKLLPPLGETLRVP